MSGDEMEIADHSRRVAGGLVLVTLGLVFSCWMSISTAQATISGSDAARSVVDEYIAALQIGDIHTMKSLLSGEYLELHRRRLSSESYSERMVKMYGSSSHTILRATEHDVGRATVDVSLQFPSGRAAEYRLFLEMVGIDEKGDPIYRIVGEGEVGN